MACMLAAMPVKARVSDGRIVKACWCGVQIKKMGTVGSASANTTQTSCSETDSEHRAPNLGAMEDILNQPFDWPHGHTKPLRG